MHEPYVKAKCFMNDREHARSLLAMVEKDLKALVGMQDNPESFADYIFGFHAQQAIEKTLKAWIAARGLVYPLTHDTSELLALLEEDGVRVGRFMELVQYDPFAVLFRYEALEEDVPVIDRSSVIEEVTALFEHVKQQVH